MPCGVNKLEKGKKKHLVKAVAIAKLLNNLIVTHSANSKEFIQFTLYFPLTFGDTRN